MLIFESQSEFEMLQFAAEWDGSMQTCYATANHGFVSKYAVV